MDAIAVLVVIVGGFALWTRTHGQTSAPLYRGPSGVQMPVPVTPSSPAQVSAAAAASGGSPVVGSAISSGVSLGGTAAASALGATGLVAGAITAGVTAGAGILLWGIADKGWFRGGEEGIKVNPARDAFLKQFSPSGSLDDGTYKLAAALTRLTGEPNGSHWFVDVEHADTMAEFTDATEAIARVLAQHGIASRTDFLTYAADIGSRPV